MFQIRKNDDNQLQVKNGGPHWTLPVVSMDGARFFKSQREAASAFGVDEKCVSRWVNAPSDDAKVRRASEKEIRELLKDQIQENTESTKTKKKAMTKKTKTTTKRARVLYRVGDDGSVFVRTAKAGSGFFRAVVYNKGTDKMRGGVLARKITNASVAVKALGGMYKTAIGKIDSGDHKWRWAREPDILRAWPNAVRVFEDGEKQQDTKAPVAAASLWCVVWPDGLTTVRVPGMKEPFLVATPVKELPKEVFTKAMVVDLRSGE